MTPLAARDKGTSSLIIVASTYSRYHWWGQRIAVKDHHFGESLTLRTMQDLARQSRFRQPGLRFVSPTLPLRLRC
jgi:hypothetical protein